MNKEKLIEISYLNKYNIDLKSIHQRSIVKSNFELNQRQIDYNKENIHRLNKIIFDDGISSSFEVIVHNNLLYLLGDKSCYPCGNIIHSSSDTFWVPVYILPNNNKILITQDVLNSSVLYFLSSYDYINQIETTLFNTYITDYLYSFSDNIWCGRTEIRGIITCYNNITPTEKFNLLKHYKLLSPFEFIIGYYIFQYKITNQDILDCLINFRKKTFINTKFYQFAKSTNEIIDITYLEQYSELFDDNDIRRFYILDYIENNVFLDNILELDINDLLGIDIHTRYKNIEDEFDYNYPKNKHNETLNSFNLTQNVKKEFEQLFINNLKEIEKYLRNTKGFKDIGSYYKETIVYNFFKENLLGYNIISQYSPKWLGRQRFDVYIKELNIAIEYNGKQHYESISFFGGDEGLKQNQIRDLEKQKKCFENNCKLYIINYDEDLSLKLNNILTEIKNLNY
ncbi:hypothetical protein [Faecalibacter macacae]|uniref:Uncharacterized protein n=1 Tax=Faecalibacter macacae TaxID=1859289 RepID=A0A3L9M9R6_9FLAO|nr:hypothetical protein [Faecalibacter macacae]RLZ09728.1 hypothetical protein EAH69_08040 [Faecalibacter macacae]